MGFKPFKPITLANFDVKWLRSITYKEFRKNAIAKDLHYETARRLWNEAKEK